MADAVHDVGVGLPSVPNVSVGPVITADSVDIAAIGERISRWLALEHRRDGELTSKRAFENGGCATYHRAASSRRHKGPRAKGICREESSIICLWTWLDNPWGQHDSIDKGPSPWTWLAAGHADWKPHLCPPIREKRGDESIQTQVSMGHPLCETLASSLTHPQQKK